MAIDYEASHLHNVFMAAVHDFMDSSLRFSREFLLSANASKIKYGVPISYVGNNLKYICDVFNWMDITEEDL